MAKNVTADRQSNERVELNPPIDSGAISQSLALIAEAPATPIERSNALLRYVLNLVGGYGISLYELSDSLELRVQVWRAEDNGFREIAIAEIQPRLSEVKEAGRAQLNALKGMPGHYAITVPWWHNGRLRGIVALVMSAQSKDTLKPYLIVLQSALGFMHYGMFRDEALDGLQSVESSAAYAELVSKMCAAPYYEESVRLMARELRKHLGCAAVGVGRVRPGGKQRIRVDTVSEAVDFNRRGTHANFFTSVMREAATSEEGCRWPPRKNEGVPRSRQSAAHEEACASHQLARTQSIPLCDADGKVGGVLTLLWKEAPANWQQIDRFLEATASHLGLLYNGLRRLDPLRLRKYADLCWQRFSPLKKWAIALLVGGALAFLAWPIAYPVRVDATVEPVLRRVVSAQFNGILREVFVEPGEFVEQGSILAVMDDKQLLWRESELLASRDRALRQRDLAMTDSTASVASAQMAQLEASGYDTELALLDFKRENLTLRAPISGIVLTGDLERVEGVPVSQGERLFEVGPMDEVILELSIPASDVNLLEPGAALQLRLASFPERSWEGTLTQIDPQSTVANGANFFMGEGELALDGSDGQLLRAGMKGRASLQGETVPRVWTFTRRLWDYLHLKFFW